MKRDDPKIFIPTERLVEGFHECENHITNLLSDSRALYELEKFSSSIALSILAHEEVAKLELLRIGIIEKKGITKGNWENMSKYGSHSHKSTAFHGATIKELKKMGENDYQRIIEREKEKHPSKQLKTYEQHIENESKITTRLKKLNEIKKSCFYLDWVQSNWFNISKIFSKYERKLFANYLLDFVGYEFFLN